MGWLIQTQSAQLRWAFGIVLILSLTAVLSLGTTGSVGTDGDWIEERGDETNSGYVLGVGLITELVEKYKLVDDDIIASTPISVDVDNDGRAELLYTTLNGTLSIVHGDNGSLVRSINIGGNIHCPPLVYDLHDDGIVDIIVFRSTSEFSTMVSINTSDFSRSTLLVMDGEVLAPSRIADLDKDGYNEILIQTFDGDVMAFNLTSSKVEWIQFLHEGLSEPPALFQFGGRYKIVIATGITYRGFDIYGSPSVYFLDGMKGEVEWNFTPGEVRIATPPTVVKTSMDDVYVAVGDGIGNTFIADYVDRGVYHSILKSELREYPEWRYINWYYDERRDRYTVILQGESAIIAVDLMEKEIIWQEWPFYLDRKVDSLYCDIDADSYVELVVLQSNNMHKRNNLMVLNATNGDVKLNMSGLPHHPLGISLSDIDGDGTIEVVVRCMNNLVVFDSSSAIAYLDLLFDGQVIEDGAEFQLYSRYRVYDLVVPAILSAPINFVEELRIVFDPSDLAILVSYSPNDTSYSVSEPEMIEVVAITRTKGQNAWSFSVYFSVNWSFPHEDPFDLNVTIRFSDGFRESVEKRDVFKVENDVEFTGSLVLTQSGRRFGPSEWFTSEDLVIGSGLKPVYQGTVDRYVDLEFFSFAIPTIDGDVEVHALDDHSLSFELDVSDYPTGRHELEMISTRFPKETDPPRHSFALLVDAEPPSISRVYPSGDNWISSRNITVGLIASDMNGSGINRSTVHLRLALSHVFNDSDDWTAWEETVALPNGFVEFRTTMTLGSGQYSYQWRLEDIAGNGVVYSEIRTFGIDLVSVEFFGFDPVGWNLNRTVVCNITAQLASEVTLLHSTIQYSYSNNVKGPWEWLEPDMATVDGRTVRLSTPLDCTEGSQNYIRWRVWVNESVSFYSETYTVLVDVTSPVFGVPSPDLTALLDSGDVEISIPISDPTSGVNTTAIEYQYAGTRDFISSNWSPVITEASDHEITARIHLTGLKGKSNYIRFRARDIAGNPFTYSPTFDIRINELPQIHSITPTNGSQFLLGEEVEFRIDLTDPDRNDTVAVVWGSDIDGVIGNGPSFMTANLSEGGHNIIILVDDGHGNPITFDLTVIVLPREQPDVPLDEIDNTLLVVMILVIVVIAVVIWRIRKKMLLANK